MFYYSTLRLRLKRMHTRFKSVCSFSVMSQSEHFYCTLLYFTFDIISFRRTYFLLSSSILFLFFLQFFCHIIQCSIPVLLRHSIAFNRLFSATKHKHTHVTTTCKCTFALQSIQRGWFSGMKWIQYRKKYKRLIFFSQLTRENVR